MTSERILYLLQLASPALPVGAYSYSEGIEALVDTGTISNESSLQHWLAQELHYGAVRLEAAVMIRAYHAVQNRDIEALSYWNDWLSAARETEELRLSSWQMGRSLVKLLLQCFPQVSPFVDPLEPCNYAIAFGIAAAFWNIEPLASVLGYLHSWTTNLVTAGVKLIPLGQTAGQRVMLNLFAELDAAATEIMALDDDDLNSCGWGLTLASMAHETQYTRLFRS